MKKYLLVTLKDNILHTERDFSDCSISELGTLLIGLKQIEKDILTKHSEEFPSEYLISDDETKYCECGNELLREDEKRNGICRDCQ